MTDQTTFHLLNSVRTFTLQRGESVKLLSRSGHHYIYVDSGLVSIDDTESGKKELTPELSRRMPVPFPENSQHITITAYKDSVVYDIDRESLDVLVSWDALNQTISEDDKELGHRMDMIRRCESFQVLPIENIQATLERMQPRVSKAGDVVMEQGDQGDNFYLLENGRAEVWQLGLYDDEPQLVAELSNGDSFGEEALITGGTRSATVKITEDSQLLVLSKEDYKEFVQSPLLNEVGPEVAKSMINEGYKLLDVRYEEEYEESYIEGSQLIPLPEIRNRRGELDPNEKYVVYCRSGKRSAVAALLLRQYAFNVTSMRGGINEWPYEKKGYDA